MMMPPPSLLHLRLRSLGDPYTENEGDNENSCLLPGNDELHDECVMCMEPYQVDDVVCKLPCGHLHHSACVTKWLSQNPNQTCPTCRHPVHETANAADTEETDDVGGFLGKVAKRETVPVFQQSRNFDLIMKRTLRAQEENNNNHRFVLGKGSNHSTTSTLSCCSDDWLVDDIERILQMSK